MKRLAIYLFIFLPLFSVAQTSTSVIRISKLILDSKKSYDFTQGDSITSIVIDTLIMKDKSQLNFIGKKKVDLVIKHAEIAKNCAIMGTDGKNNGTDLTLNVNFEDLKSLFVNVSGRDARMQNRHYNNGNGGHVTLNYLSTGKKPQTIEKKNVGYISITNQGGGHTVNPQTDIAVLMDRIRNGNPGRPLGQFPNGRVYSGGVGRDGKTSIKSVDSLSGLN